MVPEIMNIAHDKLTGNIPGAIFSTNKAYKGPRILDANTKIPLHIKSSRRDLLIIKMISNLSVIFNIISANNPLALATQIESILNYQNKHELLQKKVMKKVQSMSWPHVAEKVLKIYACF